MRTLVIIPTLNERENIERLISAIRTRLPGAHALVVDDNSQDGTATAARRAGAHVLVRTEHPGYGKSVLAGFRWAFEAEYERVITMDADFSHDPAVLPAFMNDLDDTVAVVGSRYTPGGGIANWSWHRRLLSTFSNWYVRLILGISCRDTTTGFVGYARPAVEHLLVSHPASEGYAFLVECKYLLAKASFRLKEIPIMYTERREGMSKMSWHNIWEAVWLPWKLKFGRLK